MNKSKWEWKIGNDDFDELCKDTREQEIQKSYRFVAECVDDGACGDT